MNMTKRLSLVLITGAIICGAANAWAVERDIGASVLFRQALSLSNVVDMNYGNIDYSAAAANNIDLSPNGGTITCSNTTDYTCPSTGTAGSVDISGSTGMVVQISCETGGAVTDGTNSLNLENTAFRVGGSNTDCAGLGTNPRNYTLLSSGNQVKLGARLVVPSSGIAAAGTYSTAQAGGNPVTIRVVYQ